MLPFRFAQEGMFKRVRSPSPGTDGGARQGLAELTAEEARAWVATAARDGQAPQRAAGDVERVLDWMRGAWVTGDDLCGMSGGDMREELPGVSMAVRKWLKQLVHAACAGQSR
jgi:hypothetical protein